MNSFLRSGAVVALALAAGCRAGPPPRPASAAARRATAPPPRSEPRPSEPELPPDCGDLALLARRLEAEGKGEAHPRRITVERRLAACSDRRPTAAACLNVRRETERLLGLGYGPRHPELVATNAMLGLCRETFGPAGVPPPVPPSAEDCAALPAERERLLAAGKGERHPEVLAIDARLAECAP